MNTKQAKSSKQKKKTDKHFQCNFLGLYKNFLPLLGTNRKQNYQKQSIKNKVSKTKSKQNMDCMSPV